MREYALCNSIRGGAADAMLENRICFANVGQRYCQVLAAGAGSWREDIGSVCVHAMCQVDCAAVLRTLPRPLNCQAGMAQPVLMAAAGKGHARGPAKWAPGQRLWDTMLLHKHVDTLAKYPGKTQYDEASGGNDAMFQALKKKELAVSVDAFATGCTERTTELLNPKRHHIGLSECAGVMENFDQILRDGVDRQIYHEKVLAKWEELWKRHDLPTVVKQLNQNAYPNEPRSEASMTSAVTKILQFSTALRSDWSYWAEVWCRGSCMFVDMTWLLQLATVSHPGHLAKHVQAAETLTPAETLRAKPMSNRALRDFLVAECLAGSNLRSSSAVPKIKGAASAAVTFDLTDSEDELDGEGKVDTKVDTKALEKAFAALEKHKPKRKHSAEEKMAAFQEVYQHAAEAWKALPPAAAEKVVSFDKLKETGKAKRRCIRQGDA